MTCGAPWRGGASTRASCSAVQCGQPSPARGRPRFFAPFLIRNSSTGRCGHARVQNESRARAAGTGVFFFLSLFRREPCRARTAFCTFSRFSTSFRSSGSAGNWQAWGRLGLGIRVGAAAQREIHLPVETTWTALAGATTAAAGRGAGLLE
jgi:hypothetical protein